MIKGNVSTHFFSSLGAVVLLMWLVPGCANIVSPGGGPKDSLPPVLIKANPENFTTRFNGKTVVLEFDEFIQLDNLQTELIINPPAERLPDISGRLRNVVIRIKDTLEANTTYTYQFGNAIKDVNESNPYKNFSYTFSTGNYIDSLTLGGRVTNAETGKPDSTMIVLLHSNPDDSAVAKEKPRFITRPNGKGQFMFEHLPPGSFYVFALKDEGFRKYNSNKTMFAFWGPPVAAGTADTSLELRAFVAEKEDLKQPTGTSQANDLPGRQKKDKDEKPVLRYTSSASGQEQDLLSALTLTFSSPLKSFDTSSVQLTDTLYQPLAGAQISLDTSGKKMNINFAWKEDSQYTLLIKKAFATDTLGLTNAKADTIRFKTKADKDYGNLKMSFAGIDPTLNPVIQFVQNDVVMKALPIVQNKIAVKLFVPGDYVLRILYDANQNGLWDTGDYWKKVQPEKVLSVDMKFNIKPNWENEFDISL